jgi:uncharacterized protein Usg
MVCNGRPPSMLAAIQAECQHAVFVAFKGIDGRLCDGRGNIKRCHMAETETELLLKGYGLTTAEMIYRMPDYRSVLNTFVWQDYDLAPDYPKLFGFIEFWQEEIEGPLHSVRFTHRKMISPGEWQNVTGTFTYH